MIKSTFKIGDMALKGCVLYKPISNEVVIASEVN